jgi:hypothetical protein
LPPGGSRIRARKIDVIVVYKVDRLTRSLADFAKLVELFDAHGVSFVSVTQQFNTMTSMGRPTLNVLLSFAQFEREVTSERIRDKIAVPIRRTLRRAASLKTSPNGGIWDPSSDYLPRIDWLSCRNGALLGVTWGRQRLASGSCPAGCFAWAGLRWCGG